MHKFIKHIVTCICVLYINNSCIDTYNLPIESQDSHNITVFGQITDIEGYQTVSISNSASITSTISPIPEQISGCKVILLDNFGNSFNLDEYQPGLYRVWMAKDFLKPGTSYKLKITTNSGEEIESDYDQLPECPNVDSVYFVRQDTPTGDPEKPIYGIQFYIDMDATNVNSHYFKWEIEETWEHHAVYPKTWYWNGKQVTETIPTDFSMMICWSTEKLKNYYSISTESLSQNRIIMHPLHFVDNLTQKLTYGYSILVNQYALSLAAYNYWEQLKQNNDLGELYGKQPISIKGNLRDLTSPEKKVLGVFQATSVRTKRIFVRNVADLDRFYLQCDPEEPLTYSIAHDPYAYLMEINSQLWKLEPECVECFHLSGSTKKPDFWPF